uniref:Complexin-2 n=1 Tax=Leptobrachium leishanense TaxID=445787 RepID=A0A8C5MXB2_9ANUR
MDFVMKQALGGATKDMGKMLGGEDEQDPDAQKKEEERQEALRQQEDERKAKHARMEAEREIVRQQIRDKKCAVFLPCLTDEGGAESMSHRSLHLSITMSPNSGSERINVAWMPS